jgi:hypothetical protein
MSRANILGDPTYRKWCDLPASETRAGVLSKRSPRSGWGRGLLMDPDAHNAFGERVLRVVGDENLPERFRLKGLERATRFTCEAPVRAALGVYTEALEQN